MIETKRLKLNSTKYPVKGPLMKTPSTTMRPYENHHHT